MYHLILDYSNGFELKKDIFLIDADIFKLFGTNIANLLLDSLKNFCFFCYSKQDKDIFKLPCHCQICLTCLDQIIKLFETIKVPGNKKKCTILLIINLHISCVEAFVCM